MSSNLFPAPTGRVSLRSCFVLMPFAPKFNPIYARIKALLRDACGVECMRADEIFGSHPITLEIWNSLNEARFLIADLTGRNPNVFYELGLAHALAKNVLLLTQNMADVPFDVNHIRTIKYDRVLSSEAEKTILETVRTYVSTVPNEWFHVADGIAADGSVKITGLDIPKSVKYGEQFEIRLTARNTDDKLREGYFSISFPDGIDGFPPPGGPPVYCGVRGDKWCGGQVRLRYPIIERSDSHWSPGIEHLLTFSGTCNKKGLLWVYLNASSRIPDASEWTYDPAARILDMDQRREPVYCAAIDVV